MYIGRIRQGEAKLEDLFKQQRGSRVPVVAEVSQERDTTGWLLSRGF